MTIYELWMVAPQNHIFIRNQEGKVTEYTGQKSFAGARVKHLRTVKYPCHGTVIEVQIA